MSKRALLDLEIALLPLMVGKLSLVQPQEDKEEIALTALNQLLSQDSNWANLLPPNFDHKLFIKDFLSYGLIEDLLCDMDIEDIIINALKPIYIHHAHKGFIPTDKRFESYKELDTFIKKLVIFSGRREYKKIANLELANLSGRVNIIDTPLGPQLTITKAKVDPLSVIDLIKRGTLTYEVAGQLWLYMEGMSIRPANIIIAGGPGTGKTTLLNALLSFVPAKDRLVIIEDTLELNTFLDDSCSRLETDEVLTLSDLVKNSLRMRPERVIVGEVRGEEARDMITAVNIGKYCMGTIHALTSREAIMRLHHEPMNVPEVLINLIDVFIILKRYHVDGKLYRVVEEVSETSGMENTKVLLSQLFKYSYDQKMIIPTSPSTVYRDRLAHETGLTPREVIGETWVRAVVLKTLADKNIHTLKELTTFCRYYAVNPKDAMHKIGLNRDSLLRQAK